MITIPINEVIKIELYIYFMYMNIDQNIKITVFVHRVVILKGLKSILSK